MAGLLGKRARVNLRPPLSRKGLVSPSLSGRAGECRLRAGGSVVGGRGNGPVDRRGGAAEGALGRDIKPGGVGVWMVCHIGFC